MVNNPAAMTSWQFQAKRGFRRQAPLAASTYFIVAPGNAVAQFRVVADLPNGRFERFGPVDAELKPIYATDRPDTAAIKALAGVHNFLVAMRKGFADRISLVFCNYRACEHWQPRSASPDAMKLDGDPFGWFVESVLMSLGPGLDHYAPDWVTLTAVRADDE